LAWHIYQIQRLCSIETPEIPEQPVCRSVPSVTIQHIVFLRSCDRPQFAITFIFNLPRLFGNLLHIWILKGNFLFTLDLWSHVFLISRSHWSISYSSPFRKLLTRETVACGAQSHENSLLLLRERELRLFASDHHLISHGNNILILEESCPLLTGFSNGLTTLLILPMLPHRTCP
jgi:hypothetical protein